MTAIPHSPNTDQERLDWIDRIGVWIRYDVREEDFTVLNGYNWPQHELGRGATIRQALDAAMLRTGESAK